MKPRTQALVGAVLVGLLGWGGLLITAFGANTTATQLVSATQQREADYSNVYYSCLEAEGHELLRATDRVYVAQPDLYGWVLLTKALGGWAHLQEHRAHATVAVVLVQEPRGRRGPSCDGQGLLSIRTARSGRAEFTSAPAPGGGSR